MVWVISSYPLVCFWSGSCQRSFRWLFLCIDGTGLIVCLIFDVAEREDRHELKEETKADSHEAERLERDEDRKDKAMGKAAEAEERADEDREELHDRFGVDEIPADNKSE